jgi:hypothetical protein
MEGGENGLTRKSFENLFSYHNIEFPFFKRETFGAFLHFSFFSMLFSLFFSMLHLFIEDELRDF